MVFTAAELEGMTKKEIATAIQEECNAKGAEGAAVSRIQL
jgi:hypothetical protein